MNLSVLDGGKPNQSKPNDPLVGAGTRGLYPALRYSRERVDVDHSVKQALQEDIFHRGYSCVSYYGHYRIGFFPIKYAVEKQHSVSV